MTARFGVVIVGGSAGGMATAESLRAQGYDGPVTVVSEEVHAAYDRPPLSKQLLSGQWVAEQLALRPSGHYEDLDVTVRPAATAAHVDVRERTLTLFDGSTLRYDQLVVATGVTPAPLPFIVSNATVHVLRTVDDALAMRAALINARSALVIGGGVLGTEIAATASSMGVHVTVASPRGPVMGSALGRAVGSQLQALHEANGVSVLEGPHGTVRAVCAQLGGGSDVSFEAGASRNFDVVIAAIGSRPAVEWLQDSSVELADGVLCDDDSSAAPGVFAVGDVARWTNRRFGTSMRVEHRTNATDQGMHVAERIVRQDHAAYSPVPYFWSDQFGKRIQAHGYLRDADEVQIVEGGLHEQRMVALYRRGASLTGVVTVGSAKAARTWRERLSHPFGWRDALDVT